MNFFQRMAEHGHERLIVSHDQKVGLRAVISIHNSSRGRALGGVRYKPYASDEEAIIDALERRATVTECARFQVFMRQPPCNGRIPNDEQV